VYIAPTAVIGEYTKIGNFTEVGDAVTIGKRCKIQAFNFLPKGVTIGDRVFLGPKVCFTNDRYPSAIDYGKFEETIVEDGVAIGAGSTIRCGITIGKGARIGAGSVVTRSVPAGALVYGNPAREVVENG
jgi:acetyltransferase-like isoleucine patch superfamily enzyme